ncbi:MAG: helix-turn-helix transcriptional regulator [Acidimicrobiales bacterium]
MDRLERLLNLVAALKAAERPLTRAEIRERVPGYPDQEASYRRAFERDKDVLRGMGIPITLESVVAGQANADGYRIRSEDYELPDLGLEPDELAALHLAISAVHLDGGEGVAALWKLGGAEQPSGGSPAISMAGSEHLAVLFGAVGERRAVRFSYRDDTRIIDPWRIAFRNGRWYISGRDHARDDERQFRLDRMASVEPTGDAGAFERPLRGEATAPAPWEMGDEEAIDATLLVEADHVGWAEGFLGTTRVVERRDDGSAVFGLRVTNREAFRSLVITFLDHAEVLTPPELRDDLVRWLREIA